MAFGGQVGDGAFLIEASPIGLLTAVHDMWLLLHRNRLVAISMACASSSREGRSKPFTGGEAMLQIMIFVCSVNISPADCHFETALDVISGPQAESVVACGLQGQALIAATSIARRGPGEYIKIKCSRVITTAQKS